MSDGRPKFVDKSFKDLFIDDVAERDHITQKFQTKSFIFDGLNAVTDGAIGSGSAAISAIGREGAVAPFEKLGSAVTRSASYQIAAATTAGDIGMGAGSALSQGQGFDRSSVISSAAGVVTGLSINLAMTMVEVPVILSATVVPVVGAIAVYGAAKGAQAAYEYYTNTTEGRRKWAAYTADYHYLTDGVTSKAKAAFDAVNDGQVVAADGLAAIVPDQHEVAPTSATVAPVIDKPIRPTSVVDGPKPVNPTDAAQQNQAAKRAIDGLAHKAHNFVADLHIGQPNPNDPVLKVEHDLMETGRQPFHIDPATHDLIVGSGYDISRAMKKPDGVSQVGRDLKTVGAPQAVVDRLAERVRRGELDAESAEKLNRLYAAPSVFDTLVAKGALTHEEVDAKRATFREQYATSKAENKRGASFVASWDAAHKALENAVLQRDQPGAATVSGATTNLLQLGRQMKGDPGLQKILQERGERYDLDSRPALQKAVHSDDPAHAAAISAREIETRLNNQMAQKAGLGAEQNATTPPPEISRPAPRGPSMSMRM